MHTMVPTPGRCADGAGPGPAGAQRGVAERQAGRAPGGDAVLDQAGCCFDGGAASFQDLPDVRSGWVLFGQRSCFLPSKARSIPGACEQQSRAVRTACELGTVGAVWSMDLGQETT